MMLPEYVLFCLNRLEATGYPCYAVGGCVRDALLGLIPHDYDLCTAATPEQMKVLFADKNLVLAGEKHGTVGVILPQGVVEITTFRTEGSYRDNRHPDQVCFVADIAQDLARRDFTVNAIAYSPTRGYADAFGGRRDLQNRALRAVGNAETRFREDSLRILRGVRFAVRYGLSLEKSTREAMFSLAPLMENLARERVFDELCKLLPLVSAQDLLRFAPVLTAVIPELAPTVGFQQHSPHHAYDVFTHTAHVVEAAPKDLALRWAALLHDVGKVETFCPDEEGRGHFHGHAQVSAKAAEEILYRLKAPTALREQVVFLIDKHMVLLSPERKTLKRQLSRWGVENMRKLVALQQCDFTSKGVSGPDYPFGQIQREIDAILEENTCLQIKDLRVNGNDLLALGIQGKAIGKALDYLLSQVLCDALPNEKAALMQAIKEEFL